MDCDQCCEESAEDDAKSDDNSDRPAVSPFGDHMMDQQEEEPDHAEDVDQPPPALPEDLDGNWARPQRERIRALPKPVTPTKDQRERHKLTHTFRTRIGASIVSRAEAGTYPIEGLHHFQQGA